ncbi:MAG: cytochrome c biogenesis protein CcsA [Fimbriimonadaceae bacterium]|nr:cytochrome c biogenesis protein CcsA [Fimbriimonadaceae bacterium]
MGEFGHLGWPTAPAWSVFAGAAGRVLVLAGLALFAASILFWLLAPRHARFGRFGGWAFTLGGFTVFGAILCLGSLFAGDQFQYQYVFSRGDASTALKYKIAGIWAGQEGSFLLWATTSALFGILAAPRTGEHRRWFTIPFALFLGALCGILAYETPFRLIPEAGNLVPPTGAGLTPSLQNYWVVIHPPTIFLGFGSLAVPFCWAVAAMVGPRTSTWIAGVRPWAIAGVGLLGVGLCMGGFWAYETLGWGGFWMWDPVENVSFVPWLLLVVFIHGLIVQGTRSSWGGTNLLFAGLPFLAFVYGTFLTRSGFLADASVHSFAQMDSTAHKVLLGFFFVSLLGYLALWVVRGRTVRSEAKPLAGDGVHREAGYRWGVLLLSAMAASTAIGMSVPLFMALTGRQPRVVEEHIYHLVLSWFFVPILMLMAIGPFLSWRPKPLRATLGEMVNVLSISIATIGLAMLAMNRSDWTAGAYNGDTVAFPAGVQVPLKPWVLFLAFLCIFAAAANLWRLGSLWKRGRSSAGGFLAHVGVAVLMAGLVVSRGFEQKSQVVLVEKDGAGSALGYVIRYKGRSIEKGDPSDFLFDRNNKMLFDLRGHGEEFVADPGLFYFRNTESPEATPNQMVWPSIHQTLSHDIYFTLRSEEFDIGEPQMLKPGETKQFSGLSVTYEEMVTTGAPGVPGTRFGARIKVEAPGEGLSAEVTPELELTQSGLVPHFASTGQGVLVSMQAMDAASRSALIQLHRERPAYPVELFYKPMTILVWVGTGILAIGCAIAAWFRRPRRHSASEASERTEPAIEPSAKAPVNV